MDETNYNLDSIQVLVVDSQPTARNVTRGLLYETGFREITIVSTLERARELISNGKPDLLIADTATEEGGICDLVYEVRQGNCGDPFLPVLMMSWEPTQEIVRKVIDTGADILMTMPSSKAKVVEAIESLIRRRKPFVVTSDYIGPDRRGKKEEERRESSISAIEVPNSMRSKATGKPEGDDRQACLAVINNQKVMRTGDLVESLAREIADHFSGKKTVKHAGSLLMRLNRAADDLKTRIGRSKHSHQGELCQTLLSIATRLVESSEPPAERDLELLKQVALALSLGMKSDPDTSQAAMSIVKEVQSVRAACGD